jgi:hypothetical protein
MVKCGMTREHGLEAGLARKLESLDRDGQAGADDERERRGPQGRDHAGVESAAEVGVGEGALEPPQRPVVRREGQQRLVVEGGNGHHDHGQQDEAEEQGDQHGAGDAQGPAERRALCHVIGLRAA